MERKAEHSSAEILYEQPFPTNLSMLMDKFGETQTELGNALCSEDGCPIPRQTINAYCRGVNKPDYITIVRIAKHYGVTTDWLLGMPSAVCNPNADLHGACKCLHISERIAKMIQKLIEEFGEYKLFSLLETIYSTYQRLVR